MNKQDLNLTQKVKDMSLQKAIELLELADSKDIAVEIEDAIGAYLKVWEKYHKLEQSLDKAKKAIKASLKDADTQIVAALDSFDSEGHLITKTVGSFGQFEEVRDTIDWDQLRTEKGITITTDANNPARIVIEAANAADLTLFKAPVLAGNPTAVQAAIDAGTLDAKYKHSVSTTKSDIRLETVKVTDIK